LPYKRVVDEHTISPKRAEPRDREKDKERERKERKRASKERNGERRASMRAVRPNAKKKQRHGQERVERKDFVFSIASSTANAVSSLPLTLHNPFKIGLEIKNGEQVNG